MNESLCAIILIFTGFVHEFVHSVDYREKLRKLKLEENFDDVETKNDSVVSSLEPKYPWQLLLYEEKAELFEGDIQLHQNEKPPITAELNAKRGTNWRWSKATIPYAIDPAALYTEYELATIQTAIKEFQRYTCIKWIPRTDEVDYISIINVTGCWSYVGCQHNRMQSLSLLSDSSGTCLIKGIIQHQMMHAAGFYHEQSRTDRDDYVSIHWDNIKPDHLHNFLTYSVDEVQMLDLQYDYGSIMHYGNLSFSNDKESGLFTISPKQQGAKIGQRRGLSALDVYKINRYYNCSAPTNVPSPMDDVVDPRSCTFDFGWCGWTQDYRVVLDDSSREFDEYNDDFDWMALKPATPSDGTGPRFDHTSTKGRYIYAEASLPSVEGDVARIRSPWIQGNGKTCITFWYHMFAVGVPDPMGALRVYTLERGSRTGKRLRWIRRGTQSVADTNWLQGYFHITTIQKFQVLFESVMGLNFRSDIAIDDFFVHDGVCGSVISSQGDPYLCTFEPGTCGYQQDQTDQFDWSYLDGPIVPIPGSYFYDYGSYYMVAIAQYPVMSGEAARLYTPVLTLPNITVCIHLHYWINATSGAALSLYLEPLGSQQQQIFSTKVQTTFWRHETVQTTVPPNGPFIVTFEAVRGTGGSIRDLIAMDYIGIKNC